MTYKRPIINLLPNVGYAPITAGAMFNAQHKIDTSTKYSTIIKVEKTIALLEKEESDGSILDYRWELLQLCRDARRVGLDDLIVYIEDGSEEQLLFGDE